MFEKAFFMNVGEKKIKLLTKNFVSVFESAICKKSSVLKKLSLVYFFKSDLKMLSYEKSEDIQSSVFQKRSIGRFLFFLFFQFFLSLLKKYTRYSFFNDVYLHISPVPKPIETKTLLLPYSFVAQLVV